MAGKKPKTTIACHFREDNSVQGRSFNLKINFNFKRRQTEQEISK